MRPALALVVLVWAGAALTTVASGSPPVPFGVPVPSSLGAADLLPTSDPSGDVRGIPGARTCESAPHAAIALPSDDAPHPGTYLEWWWWRGQVETADGRRYGFMLDLTTKPWAHVYGIDYGVTDLATGTYHYTKEALLVGEPVSTPGGFSAASRDASARGGDGRDRLRISVDGYELKASIRATGRPVFLFGDGHLNAYCNAAYFYSRPAMQVTGTLTHSGHTARVSGTSIFDHNWGFDPAQELAGWDWLNFQLADGSAISIVVVSVAKGVDKMAARTGWMTDPGGHVTALHWQDFNAAPTRYWQRDPTCRYPVDWDVVVKGLHLRAHADLDRTEMRALKSPEAYVLWPGWPLIWDGPTTVSGDAAGRGWNDLGHYCYV